jgi:hypothetical protein
VTNCFAGKIIVFAGVSILVAGQRLEHGDALDFIAEELDAQRVLAARRTKLNRIAAHAKLAALERDVVPVYCRSTSREEKLLARDACPTCSGMTIFS